MTEKHVCPICGEETSSYMGNYRKDGLCRKHATDLKNGKIILCNKCGKYHESDKPCTCEKSLYTELPVEGFDKCLICGKETNGYAFCRKCFKEHTEEELLKILNNQNNKHINKNLEDKTNITNEEQEELNNTVVIDIFNKPRCITCGKQTGGFLFCPSCYQKYKDKELLFKIKNCTNVELLDEDYEGRYTCKDGHIVKSKSERDIDDYLFDHDIKHIYERKLQYGASENEVLRPDFYLPDYLGEGKHVYIEHWGYNENNIKYTKTKKFKMPIYRELGITLICTYEKTDMGEIDTTLERKLNKAFITPNTINWEESTKK